MIPRKHTPSEIPNAKRSRETNPEEVTPPPPPSSPHPFDPTPFPSKPLSFSRMSHLRNHFSNPILQWMLDNTTATVDEALSTALGTRGPMGTIPEGSSPRREQDDGFTDDDDPAISYRDCRYCLSRGNRDYMAKYRECHEWSHTLCAEGSQRHGRTDPQFSFWLCPECRSPWLSEGHPRQRTVQEIAEDTIFEDSDNEILA